MSTTNILERPDPIPDGPDYADQVLADLDALELVSCDGEPLESDWHRKNINLLVDQIQYMFRGREDYYVGGNMFIYFSREQATNRDFRGPDFFFVSRTHRHPMRPFWAVWDEGLRLPDVVIELASPTTVDEDRGVKFEVYRDVLRVANYFIYDPESKSLEGWQLERNRYVPLKVSAHGRLRCEELDAWLGPWEGEYVGDQTTWLRFFQDSGAVLPVALEAEKQRADALEAENARLKLMLAQLQTGSANGATH